SLREQFGGLIGVDSGDARWLQALTQSGLPAVRFGYFPIDVRVPQIVGDAFLGSLRVVEHLISHGHKRIAIWRVGIPPRADGKKALNEREKYAAYRFALAEAGIEFQKSWELEMGYVWQDIAKLGQQLMSIKPAPTALFIDNDWVTSMIMRWPGGELPVAKDILSSFEIGHYVDSGRDPSDFLFACAEQPMDRMGELAADILLHELAGRHYAPDYLLKVPPHFFTAQQVIDHAKKQSV
ncbi:MAG TPA: substrate-binding domain-containing protein, partial [Planctomycetota bacterium]|nr:substrate-binding domain-containing protein [Planctomycetota bacterium]